MRYSVRHAARLVICIALLAAASPVWAQSSWRTVYEQYADSVVLVRVDLKIDREYVQSIDTFRKWEASFDEPLMGQYVTLASGSGFYISEDGHIATNRHVAMLENEQESRDGLFQAMRLFILADVSDSGLTDSERSRLLADLRRICSEVPITINVVSRDGSIRTAELLFSDTDLDLGLLKVASDEPVVAIPLGFTNDTFVGDDVAAIGYPLGVAFDYFFEDFQPTMSAGIISAIRDDEWAIQHTAAVNPGSSGGPLIGSDMLVKGVIVGTIANADQLQFAISATDVIEVLRRREMQRVLESNRSAGYRVGLVYDLQPDGSLLTSTRIVVDTIPGMDVLVDGEVVGMTPMTLSVDDGEHTLELVGDQYESTQRISVDATATAPFVYTPRLRHHAGTLIVTTDPSGADVYLGLPE